HQGCRRHYGAASLARGALLYLHPSPAPGAQRKRELDCTPATISGAVRQCWKPRPEQGQTGPHTGRRTVMFIVDFAAGHPWVIAGIVITVAVVAQSIRVANQYERGVVFRLGKFNRTAGPGLYLVWPLIEWQI